MPRPLRAGAKISTVQLLHLAASKADSVFEERAKDGDISPREYEVLASAARTKGLSQTDIMLDTGIDRSSVAQLTLRLVKRGWLHRRRSKKDRRIYTVRLTTKGQEAFARYEPVSLATEEILLQRLSRDERANLVRALQSLL